MMKNRISIAVALALFASSAAAATIEEKIELLQQEIEALKDQVESKQAGDKAGGAQSLMQNTTLGGYGELHYNNFSGDVPLGKTRKKDEIDFHRFVLFFGHKFNDWISFKSELELEHALAGEGKTGEIELEQAYLDFNFNSHFNAKAGVFLLPMGILNETHEPTTFYGVERNEIESRIIPSTWWEAGAGLYGEALPGLNYQLNATSSLDAGKYKSDFSNGVRDGRRKTANAPAENIAFSGALNYTGVPGLLVGAAFFTGETGQDGASNNKLSNVDARLTLWDVHARYQKDRFDLRALYASGHLSDAEDIKKATGINAAENFYGWYAEAAYHVWKHGDHDLAPFVRYESWDTHDNVPSNVQRIKTNKNNVWTAGVNYWPHPQVVLKADYQDFDKEDGDKGDKRFNMGLGYMY
jgi:phosphate-selective porin